MSSQAGSNKPPKAVRRWDPKLAPNSRKMVPQAGPKTVPKTAEDEALIKASQNKARCPMRKACHAVQ